MGGSLDLVIIESGSPFVPTLPVAPDPLNALALSLVCCT